MTRNELLKQQTEVQANIQRQSLAEVERHNVETERMNRQVQAENRALGWFKAITGMLPVVGPIISAVTTAATKPHEVAIQEKIAQENIRHNQAMEDINSGNLLETVRHNQAMESVSSGNAVTGAVGNVIGSILKGVMTYGVFKAIDDHNKGSGPNPSSGSSKTKFSPEPQIKWAEPPITSPVVSPTIGETLRFDWYQHVVEPFTKGVETVNKVAPYVSPFVGTYGIPNFVL